MRGRAALGIALGLTLAVGCSSPTRLVVVVDTDMSPEEVSHVSVGVSSGPVGSAGDVREFTTEELPIVAVAEDTAERPRDVLVFVQGIDPDRDVVVWRDVQTRLLAGHTLVLEIPLARACAHDEVCGDMGQTCLDGACVPIFVDPSTLPEGDADGDPMRLFSGPSEPDAGTLDAGLACTPDMPCETDDPCRRGTTRCVDGVAECDPAMMMPEGTDCGDGRTCNAEGQCGRP